MLRVRHRSKEAQLPGRTKEGRPIEMLLAALCVFSRLGKEEVSLSELQESIAEFQQHFHWLGYSYSDRFLYSLDLLLDLQDLQYHAYVRQYHYRHDAFLPKSFVGLSPFGRVRGYKVLETLSEEVVQGLDNAVSIALRNYENRWRLWARRKQID